MPARSPFPMTSLTVNENKPRALPDAEFDSPTAGEGAETIPPLAKDDGARKTVFFRGENETGDRAFAIK